MFPVAEIGGSYAEMVWVELRIHDETERGDNETIRLGGNKVGVATRQCYGGER